MRAMMCAQAAWGLGGVGYLGVPQVVHNLLQLLLGLVHALNIRKLGARLQAGLHLLVEPQVCTAHHQQDHKRGTP
jgi:hypothetical protein